MFCLIQQSHKHTNSRTIIWFILSPTAFLDLAPIVSVIFQLPAFHSGRLIADYFGSWTLHTRKICLLRRGQVFTIPTKEITETKMYPSTRETKWYVFKMLSLQSILSKDSYYRQGSLQFHNLTEFIKTFTEHILIICQLKWSNRIWLYMCTTFSSNRKFR